MFFNQLRYSVDENYDDDDLYDAIKIVSQIIVDKTKNSYYPIRNVAISSGCVMETYGVKTKLDIDPAIGLDYFYSDIDENDVCFLVCNGEIELGRDNYEIYDVPRKNVKFLTKYKDIKENMNQIKLYDGLIKGKNIDDIKLFSDEFLDCISKLYVGEDWFIGLNENNKIVIKYVLRRSYEHQRKAKKEMNFILEKIGLPVENNINVFVKKMRKII